MNNANLLIAAGVGLILLSWLQIALAYVAYKGAGKAAEHLQCNFVMTPMGSVDVAKVKLNHLELIALRQRLIDSKYNLTLLRNIPSHKRIRDELYMLLIAELKLTGHLKRYDFSCGNLDECIRTLNIVINEKSLKVRAGWTIFDSNDRGTHPKEGNEVLCFVPGWASYRIFHLIYSDDAKPCWYCGSESITDSDAPLVWQNINTDHAKA